MFRRSVRIACLVIGLLATAGISYRVLEDESALSRDRGAAVTADQAVNGTVELLQDLRASLHAYVAPGQGLPFWGKRAQEGIEALRERLVTLDEMASPRGSLEQSLDGVDQLAAAERRARTYVSRDEMQLAGDVIFTEVRDILAVAEGEVHAVRLSLKRAHDTREAAVRREQALLAGGVLALWVVIALLLLPTEQRPAVQDPAQWRTELKETLKKPIPVVETPRVIEPPPVTEPAKPVVAIETLRTVSEICADLSALSDPGALQGALERVDRVMHATGLIVWVASNDGSSLTPVATHGFDPKLVTRIGRIGRDSANLTAAAFRESAPKVSAATATAPAALAVPMCGPTGPAGVLSIELKAGQAVAEADVALATILAAQLATLAMPLPGQLDAEPATRAVV